MSLRNQLMRDVVILTALSGVVGVLLAGCASSGGSDAASAVWETVTSIDWRLESLDGRPPIAGTSILLRLTRYGDVSGNTGVNRYGGTYLRGSDGDLHFGRLRVTLRAQPDPPGVMEQETAYVALLERVTGYRVEDGRLLLLADSEVVLEFVPSSAT